MLLLLYQKHAKSSLFRAVGDIKTQLKICECQKVRGIGTSTRATRVVHGFAKICKCEKAFLKASRHV